MTIKNRLLNSNFKSDFKIFKTHKDLVYLNTSASSLKPNVMINELAKQYEENINTLNRSFNLKENNNDLFFNSMKKISDHINAKKTEVFPVGGTTDGLNKLANSIINNLQDGDEIILGKLEHASNILPWTSAIKTSKKKITIKWYELKDWTIDLDHLKNLVSKKTKLISIAHIYNTSGVKNDILKLRNIIGKDVLLIVDGAQSIGHIKIDVKKMDCDYFVFGAHKALGPLGLGFIYGKENLLNKLEPFSFGGGMNIVYDEKNIEYAQGIKKFLGGTQNLPSVIAFSKSIEYLEKIGLDNIEKHNLALKEYAEKKFISEKINGKIINKNIESSILFFEINNVAGEDVAYHLANENIIVRSGSSCVKIKNNLYKQFKSIRASFYIYNSIDDIDKLIESLKNGGDFLDALFKKRPVSELCK